MAGVLINGQEPILRDLAFGTTATHKVLPADARNMDLNDSLTRTKIEKHVAATGVFLNNALVDGPATLRTPLTLAIYERAILFLSTASPVGAPSVACKVFVNHLVGQTFSAASRAATWLQIGDTLTLTTTTSEEIELPTTYQEVGVEVVGSGSAGVDQLNVTATLWGRA